MKHKLTGDAADFIKNKIQDGSHLSIVSAYFTIYAYDALKDNLDRIEHLDFRRNRAHKGRYLPGRDFPPARRR